MIILVVNLKEQKFNTMSTLKDKLFLKIQPARARSLKDNIKIQTFKYILHFIKWPYNQIGYGYAYIFYVIVSNIEAQLRTVKENITF